MLGPNSVHMKYMQWRVSVFCKNANAILANKLAYFRDRFEININRYTLNDNITKIKLSIAISDDEQLIINIIWSLQLKKNQISTLYTDLMFV